MQKERKCCTKRTPFFSKTLPTSHSKLEGPGHTNSFSVVTRKGVGCTLRYPPFTTTAGHVTKCSGRPGLHAQTRHNKAVMGVKDGILLRESIGQM